MAPGGCFAILSKNKWFPLLMTSIIFGSLHLAKPIQEILKAVETAAAFLPMSKARGFPLVFR